MNDDLENGARPVAALGQSQTKPFGRVGALVFQPDDTEKSKWADPQRSDPDSRLWQDDNRVLANTRLEKRLSQKETK